MFDDPALQSTADVWYLKRISFNGSQIPIITQNFNGPCSFIALCNILILRGNITIEPPTRQTVSYEFLSQLVAEYLLIRSPNVDISAALSIMPHTQKGLDLNPIFTSPTSFRAATSTAGGELALFSQVGIDLVHGWLVDPDSEEARAMKEEGTEDYDSAVGLIAEADHVAGGLLVLGDIGIGEADGRESGSGRRREEEWTAVERRKIQNALTIRHFLEQTQSQLTYHGLFHLASSLPSGELVALFRSSHLSVLYKSPPSIPIPNSKLEEEAERKGPRGPVLEKPSEWQILDDTPPLAGPSPSITAPARSPSEQQPSGVRTQSPSSPEDQRTGTTAPPPQHQHQHQHQHQPPAPNPLTTTITAPQPETQTQITIQSHIHTLATDQVFLHEPSVVWERIEDVDGAAGVFVDSNFARGVAANGDWARSGNGVGQQQQQGVGGGGGEGGGGGGGHPMTDAELAQHLQAEEEHLALQAYLAQEDRRNQHQEVERLQREAEATQAEEKRQKELHARRAKNKHKNKRGEDGGKKCVVM